MTTTNPPRNTTPHPLHHKLTQHFQLLPEPLGAPESPLRKVLHQATLLTGLQNELLLHQDPQNNTVTLCTTRSDLFTLTLQQGTVWNHTQHQPIKLTGLWLHLHQDQLTELNHQDMLEVAQRLPLHLKVARHPWQNHWCISLHPLGLTPLCTLPEPLATKLRNPPQHLTSLIPPEADGITQKVLHQTLRQNWLHWTLLHQHETPKALHACLSEPTKHLQTHLQRVVS